MKKIIYLLIVLAIISCSSNDDSGTNTPEESYNYFPLTSGTYWTYNNESDQGISRDSLFIGGSEEVNGKTYRSLGAEQPASGFMTLLLSRSLLRSTDTELILNGELGAPPVEGFPEISIPLNDVVLYDAIANNGTVLSEVSGEIEQTVQDIPLIIGYTIKTIQDETIENSFEGNITVMKSKIIVNLSIDAEVELIPGTTVTIPVLASQDIVVVTNQFAENIGLINSETNIQYELEDLGVIGDELPFPSEDTQTANQVIDNYNIVN